jgi:glycosyltransferase involved in cell wall biosynthesis
MKKLGLIYLGRRGGGALLTKQIVELADKSNVNILTKIWLHRRNSDYPEDERVILFYETPSIFAYMYRSISVRIFSRNVVRECVAQGIHGVIFPMPSPFDIILARALQNNNIKVIRIIHDSQPHLGEFWPTKYITNKLIKHSDLVVTLSQYVNRKIDFKNRIVVRFPHYIPQESHYIKKSGQVCMLGRRKRYKGMKLGMKAFKSLEFQNLELIANCRKNQQKHEFGINRVTSISGWLTDQELERVIGESEVLLLPYLEATQSGLVNIASSLNTFVIATPAGGLPEQIIDLQCGVTTEDFDYKSIAKALSNFFNGKNFLSSDYNFRVNSASDCRSFDFETFLEIVALKGTDLYSF